MKVTISEEAYNYDKAMRLKEVLSKDKDREYWRNITLQREEYHLDTPRPLLKWDVPEYQKPVKNRKTLLDLILSNF